MSQVAQLVPKVPNLLPPLQKAHEEEKPTSSHENNISGSCLYPSIVTKNTWVKFQLLSEQERRGKLVNFL